MTWGAPHWLWLGLLVPVFLVLFLHGEIRRGRRIAAIVAARLESTLLRSVSPVRRRLRFALSLAGLIFVVLALAQPRYGTQEEEISVMGRDVIFALDVSRSMLATDINPSRLGRAKLAAEDLLNLLRGERVGVVAFAGTAFLQAPLTIDHGAVLDSLRSLDPQIIPQGGTNLAAGIKVAIEGFGKGEGTNRALVVFSDGEELQSDALESAREAAKLGIRIFTVAIGTREGSLIPVTAENGGTDFVRDRSGNTVRTRLEEDRLREISNAAEGDSLNLLNQPNAARSIAGWIDRISAQETAAGNRSRALERYQWPLAAAFTLLLLGFMIREARPARMAALILLGLFPQARAEDAFALYHAGKFTEAFEAFQSEAGKSDTRAQFNAGAAAYGAKDFPSAMERFGATMAAPDKSLKAAATYNLANTLARQTDAIPDLPGKIKSLEDALKHYDAASNLDPENTRIPVNRRRVEEYLNQLREMQKRQEEQKKQQDQKDQKQDKKEEQKDKPDKSDKSDKSDQKKDESKDKSEPSQDQKDQPQEKEDPAKDGKEGDKKEEKQDDQQKSESQSGDQPKEDSGQQPAGDKENGEGKKPEPSASPEPAKDLSGELKSQKPVEPSQEKGQPAGEAAEAAEPATDGRMSEGEARALLRSLEGQEDKIDLLLPAPQRPVEKDW